MEIGYDELRRALTHGTKGIDGPEDFAKWAKKQGVNADDLERMSQEIATVAIKDIRESERGLVEGVGGAFLSGFITGFRVNKLG